MLDAYVVGGVAVHIYTQHRVSTDMDATFSHRILVPQPPVVVYEQDGARRAVRLDTNYSEVLGLMHHDWKLDALDAGSVGRIRLKVISPRDLAVSKVARFADNGREDIRELAEAGLLDPESLEVRCSEALNEYVGDTNFVLYNIRDAIEMVRSGVGNRAVRDP